MTMTNYIGVVSMDEDGDYRVELPDFPGVVGTGKTVEEMRRNAREALKPHIEGLLKDGKLLPEPTALERIFATPPTMFITAEWDDERKPLMPPI
jgi:predicted RNase H-like HicB family nuclease